MKIVNLMENTEGVLGLHTEHGLSFYIETPKHKILVDAGATGAFAENAGKLGVDLSGVDIAVLSHGHYDHSGGLETFAQINPKAPIYMRANAVDDFYHVTKEERRYIGISAKVKSLPQNIFVTGDIRIDGELGLFTNVKGRRCWPSGNLELKKLENGEFVQDDFSHEQYLVISESGEDVLISGCAHNGILNILDCYRERYGKNPGKVISGFHMMKKQGFTDADVAEIEQTAKELATMDTHFYTGHCTGTDAYDIMKKIMGDKLEYIHCGEEI